MPKQQNGRMYSFFRSLMFGALYTPVNKELDVGELNQDFYNKDPDNIKLNLLFDLDGKAWPIGTNSEREQEDKPLLDAVIMTSNKRQIYDPKKIYIIVADDGLYEQQDFSMYPLVNEGIANVIGFNPMGTGMSSGATTGPEDYQLALRSIIDNLESNDIPSGNIIVVGGSFPGAMATLIVEDFQANGKKIGLLLKQEKTVLENVYDSYIPKLLRPLYRYLSNIFGLNVDAKKSFESMSQNAELNVKIIPEAQLNDYIKQLHQDSKTTLSAIDDKSKKLLELSKLMLTNSIRLADELQKKYSIEDIHAATNTINQLDTLLSAQVKECKQVCRELNAAVLEADTKHVMSRSSSAHITNLLDLAKNLLTQQGSLETAVEKYKEVNKTGHNIVEITKRIQNILTNGMYSSFKKQQDVALENNRQQLRAENENFVKQKNEVDQITANARSQLQTVKLI